MSKPVAKNLDEEEALREVIDALRADNARLLRLLIAGFVSDGRPEHKELTEVLAHYPNLRNWLGTGESIVWMPTKIKSRKGKTAIKTRRGKPRLKRGVDVEEGASGRKSDMQKPRRDPTEADAPTRSTRALAPYRWPPATLERGAHGRWCRCGALFSA